MEIYGNISVKKKFPVIVFEIEDFRSIEFQLNVTKGHCKLIIPEVNYEEDIKTVENIAKKSIIAKFETLNDYRKLVAKFLQSSSESNKFESNDPFEYIFNNSFGFKLESNDSTFSLMKSAVYNEEIWKNRKTNSVGTIFKNIICHMPIADDHVLKKICFYMYEFPDIPRPLNYQTLNLFDYRKEYDNFVFLTFYIELSDEFEEKIREKFKIGKDKKLSPKDKMSYFLSPEMEIDVYCLL